MHSPYFRWWCDVKSIWGKWGGWLYLPNYMVCDTLPPYTHRIEIRAFALAPSRAWLRNMETPKYLLQGSLLLTFNDNVIKWKHFPRYWPFVRGIHRLPVNSPLKGQWPWALRFSLICAWTNSWVNNRGAGDLRRHCVHYDVTAMH